MGGFEAEVGEGGGVAEGCGPGGGGRGGKGGGRRGGKGGGRRGGPGGGRCGKGDRADTAGRAGLADEYLSTENRDEYGGDVIQRGDGSRAEEREGSDGEADGGGRGDLAGALKVLRCCKIGSSHLIVANK